MNDKQKQVLGWALWRFFETLFEIILMVLKVVLAILNGILGFLGGK